MGTIPTASDDVLLSSPGVVTVNQLGDTANSLEVFNSDILQLNFGRAGNGQLIVGGDVTVQAGGQITGAGELDAQSIHIVSMGTIAQIAATNSNAALVINVGSERFPGTLDNSGELFSEQGDLQLNGALNNHGLTLADNGHSLQVGDVTNDGLIEASGPGSKITILGSLNDSGSINAFQNAQISVQGLTTITSSGSVTAISNAKITFMNKVNDAGMMIASDGSGGELDFLQGLTMPTGVHLSTGQGGTIQINGDAIGGTATLGLNSLLGLSGNATTNVQFNGSTDNLVLASSASYSGTIISFGATDSIDAKDILFNSLQHSFDSTTGILMLTDARGAATIHFQNPMAAFSFSNDGQGGTLITGGGGVTWVSEGPSPGINGQQGPSGKYDLGGLNTDGAIQAIAVNPDNPNIMYVATVNGGVWETTNATAATPHWVTLTDTLPSLSMGALAFDPTDPTDQTLIAGIGATSSFSAIHNTLSGVLLTTDGGKTWSQLGTTDLAGDNITSVAARGTTLLAAADSTWSGVWGSPSKMNGLFRSTDTGTRWTNISDGKHGLPNNVSVSDLAGDPLNPNVFYAGVTGATGGVFKSTDGGLDWTKITGIGIINNTTDKILLAVHDDGTHVAVFATVDNQQTLSGVFQSLDGGSFKALDVPAVPNNGNGGNLFGSISADPTNPNIVYVGYGAGDAGTNGYLTRIDASKTAGSQITPLNGGSFGSPHADLRDMQIDADGNLILSSDGGLSSLPTPTENTGAWKAIGGDIGAFELHDIAYDHVSHVIVAGSQDNGTLAQLTPGDTTWNTIEGGDGGDVAIDDVSLAGVNESIRYVAAQNLLSFQRQVYDSANNLVGKPTFLAAIPDGQFITPLAVNNVDAKLILVGGSAHIYMSSDQGTTLTPIFNKGVNSGPFSSVSGATMVYGGDQNGVANPDLIYAASGTNVLTKTTAGGGFTSTTPNGGTIVGVTDNPNNWATVFAIDNKQVFESTDAGGKWVPVTDNLASISGGATVYSIAYVPDAGNDALVVGTSSGVFDAHVSGLLGGTAAWSQFGANLPNVIVSELQYDAHDNVLVAATMGRGAWLVNNVTEALAGISAGVVGIADLVNSHMV
jgi:hypothetical protein